jgi:2',3'-cyclic-nucleotide 2'-phosphodiesterase (5'-nucleotidase family)
MPQVFMLLRPKYIQLHALVLAAALLLGGCRTTGPVESTALGAAPDFAADFVVITDSISDDAALEAQIRPYRAEMHERVSEVIARAPSEISRAKPEGRLGNITADAMLVLANESHADSIHMALTNNGGLRVPIGPGDITIGTVYELMPFENRLVVLTMNGVQVDTLVNQLASLGGEAIAGFSFVIEDNRAVNVRVRGEPVVPDALYRLVTSDFVADGGDRIITFTPLERSALPMLLRDVFIDYFRRTGTLEPEIEGRITIR